MSSVSVRFNSFSFLYSIFNEHKFQWLPSLKLRISLTLDSLSPHLRGLKFQLFAVLPRALAPGTAGWSVWMDSNHRPHAYQACALTTWATNRFLTHLVLGSSIIASAYTDWWRWWGSNPWPPACRAGALPAELHPRIYGFVLFQWSVQVSLFLILENWTTKVPYKLPLKTSLVNRLRYIRENVSWSP